VVSPQVAEEKTKHESFTLQVKDKTIPVTILFEKRFNNKVYINHLGINMSINNQQSKDDQKKSIDYFLKWAKNKLDKKPHLLEYLPQRKYANGEILQVGKDTFTINVFYHSSEKSTAKLFKHQIIISLCKGLTPKAEQDTCSFLVSKCLIKYFTPIVTQRVHALNDAYFKKEINNVRLKYNTSNWGSCSTQGNVNISLRLMFAPQDVIDYVIVHELAHLYHMNHSKKFWALVEKVMPDYREKEKHLEENNFKYYL
jgi:hypothetical protein